MSLRRKAYKVTVAVWEALVTTWYMLAIASFAVLILFLAAFIISAAFDLSDKMIEKVTGP